MELTKRLELYAGKKIDYIDEVILQDDSDGKGAYIKEWKVAGVKKPEIDKLQDYQESEYISKFGIEKTDKQRLDDLESEIKKMRLKSER